MNKTIDIQHCVGFQWDTANIHKNWLKHKVTPAECEQIFFNQPLVITDDVKHSTHESRHYALGHTDTDRLLVVVFTVRGKLIRVISTRDMHRNERSVYGAYEKDT